MGLTPSAKTFIQMMNSVNNDLIASLFDLMKIKLAPHEELNATLWCDNVWYLEVTDNKLKEQLDDGRAMSTIPAHVFTLSVDVLRDRILWNDLINKNPRARILDGSNGACFVRGRKWLKFFKDNFWENGQDRSNINDISKPMISCYGYKRNPLAA